MAKRKRVRNAGGVARHMNFTPTKSPKQETLDSVIEKYKAAVEFQEVIVMDIRTRVKTMFKSCLPHEDPEGDTKSIRIKSPTYTAIKAESNRLGISVHRYMATVTTMTTLFVKNDTSIEIDAGIRVNEDGTVTYPSGLTLKVPEGVLSDEDMMELMERRDKLVDKINS